MMNKIERLNDLIVNNTTLGLELVSEVNGWDASLESLQLYLMDEFNELMSGISPLEIANTICYGSFNPNDDYFRFNVFGNLESLDEYEAKEEIISYSEEIATRVVELHEDGVNLYLNDEVLEALEEEEEDC